MCVKLCNRVSYCIMHPPPPPPYLCEMGDIEVLPLPLTTMNCRIAIRVVQSTPSNQPCGTVITICMQIMVLSTS